MSFDGSAYVLGHTKDELSRLEVQGEIFREPTEEVLAKAGISEGMRVLDIGCGVGDVTLIAARAVGSSGSVVAVDQSDAALEIGRMRAGSAGLDNVVFDQADINRLASGERFDAIIGRFILMHLPDPTATLKSLLPHLSEGGAVAFLEFDIGSAGTTPEMPLFDQCIDWLIRLYRQAGAEPNMGSKLYATFRAAGLTPELSATCRVEAGSSANVPDYLAETMRSIAPQLEELGISEGVGIDTLRDRLVSASVSGDHCFFYPRLVGAWVPASR